MREDIQNLKTYRNLCFCLYLLFMESYSENKEDISKKLKNTNVPTSKTLSFKVSTLLHSLYEYFVVCFF